MASAGNVMLRGQYTDLFVSRLPFLDEILFEQFDAPSLTYTEIFNVRDSSRAYEEITGITGFDQFGKKTEGAAVTYDKLLQGFDKRFTHSTFAKGLQISMEAMDDDIDGAISNAAPALARAARNSIETQIFALLNEGFSTTGASATPDGAALFSASHLLVGGGTFDNLVAGDLAQATLEEAINIYADMRDDRNQLIDLDPAMLIIPPELRWVTHELLKSQLRSDTANNAANALNQLGLKIVLSKYLTGDDDWFLSTEPSRHRVIVYWRMEPVTDHTMDFDTGNMKSKMTYRLSFGAADWRGWVGGQGA
jgi:phage major head subunit gpT-like protein